MLHVLAGQYEHAGVLGELVVQADRASVAQELGGDPARAMAAPRHALQRKLLDGLRFLLKEQLKLNQPEASDGWLTEDGLWLVSKTVSDKLRAHLLSQGIDGIPANNTAVFNVLQDHGMLQPTSDGKAVWRATVTSATGWSYSFTLLRLAPALIWESGERPALFAGTVAIDTTPAEINGSAPGTPPAVVGQPAPEGQETPPWDALAAIPPCRLRPRPCPTSWRTCCRWLDWMARPTWGRVKSQWRKSLPSLTFLPQPQPQRLPCHLPLRLDLHQLQQSRYHPGSIS